MFHTTSIENVRRSMDKVVEEFKKTLATLRTGQASANILDSVRVEAYDTIVPLSQMAAVSVGEPRTLLVSVWDKQNVKAVESALRESRLGLSPIVDGTNIRIPLPAPTEERRKELVRLAKEYAESARIAVRNIRQLANKALITDERSGKHPQHVTNSMMRKVQESTDKHIEEINTLVSSKEKEILKI